MRCAHRQRPPRAARRDRGSRLRAPPPRAPADASLWARPAWCVRPASPEPPRRRHGRHRHSTDPRPAVRHADRGRRWPRQPGHTHLRRRRPANSATPRGGPSATDRRAHAAAAAGNAFDPRRGWSVGALAGPDRKHRDRSEPGPSRRRSSAPPPPTGAASRHGADPGAWPVPAVDRHLPPAVTPALLPPDGAVRPATPATAPSQC